MEGCGNEGKEREEEGETDRQGEGASDSEISIVWGLLCVSVWGLFWGAQGGAKKEAKRRRGGSYPGPSDKRHIVLPNVWRHLWRNAII